MSIEIATSWITHIADPGIKNISIFCLPAMMRRARFNIRAAMVSSVLVGSTFLTACTQLSEIPRTHSAIEQELLVRALERSLDKLDPTGLSGKTVSLKVSVFSKGDMEFVNAMARAWLREKGIHIANGSQHEADAEVQVFANVFGTDHGESFVGLPSLSTPMVNLSTPEIALFKHVANRGRSEVQLYVFDPRSGDFIRKTPVSVGESKFDNYKILLFIKYTVDDLGLPDDRVVQEENRPRD